MKEQIIEILGKNHTTPCVFTNDFEVAAIYTYKNDVFCLNMGSDFEFDALSDKVKNKIVSEIVKGNYKKDKSFQ